MEVKPRVCVCKIKFVGYCFLGFACWGCSGFFWFCTTQDILLHILQMTGFSPRSKRFMEKQQGAAVRGELQ